MIVMLSELRRAFNGQALSKYVALSEMTHVELTY
jgi:hypothetical protein